MSINWAGSSSAWSPMARDPAAEGMEMPSFDSPPVVNIGAQKTGDANFDAPASRRASRSENLCNFHRTHMVRKADVDKWFLAFWFSPDGHSFAAGAKEIHLHDTETGKKTLVSRRTSLVYACACSPDGVLFCIGDEEGHLIVYYLGPPARTDGEEAPALWKKQFETSVTDAQFSRDGKWIATICRNGEAALHDAIDGKQPARKFTRKQLDSPVAMPFRANSCHDQMSSISFCDHIVAIAGGKDHKSDTNQDSMLIGLWSVPEMVELQCIDLGINAVTPVTSVAFRPDGRQLAVGTESGTIRVYPVEPDPTQWLSNERGPPAAFTNTPIFWRNDLPPGAPATLPHAVAALSFSNTPGCAFAHANQKDDVDLCSFCGCPHRSRWLLAAGLETGKFRIIDCQTTADTANFEIPRSAGTVCAFAPHDDVIGIGGGSAQAVELHEIQPIAPSDQYSLTTPAGSDRRLITASCVSEDYVCMVNGSQIEVYTRSNKALLRQIDTSYENLSPRLRKQMSRDDVEISAQTVPISVRPNGGYVACVLSQKSVAVYEIDTGKLALQIPQPGLKPYRGNIHGVTWSPNGKYMVAWGPFGVRINTAPDHNDIHLLPDLQPGDDVLEFSDFGAVCTNCAINNRGNRIASCGYSDTVVVRSLPDGTKLFTFRQGDDGQPPGSTGGVCWSDDAKRLAYHVDETLLVRAMEDSSGRPGRVIARFEGVDAVPVAHGAFSPGSGGMILALEGVLGPDKPDDTHQVLLLDIATQKRLPCDSMIRPCLPPGEILSHGIGWLPTVPAYTFDTCTLMVQGLGKPYLEEHRIAQLFTAKHLNVIQCTVRMKKGSGMAWALVTLANHSSCVHACEAGQIEAPGLGLKITQVQREKAEESTGAFLETWKIARQKAAEADRLFGGNGDSSSHHEAYKDLDVEDAATQDEQDIFGGTEGGKSAPLLLYGAADHHLVVMDMRQFRYSAEDGAHSQAQLNMLSKWDPEAISAVTERLPHLVCTRSVLSGDTVLHTCVRHSMISQLERWLSGQTLYTPIVNFTGQTALHEAITSHNRQCTTVLFKRLMPSLNDVSSPLVTESLRLIAKELPELTLQILQLIELPRPNDDDNRVPAIQTVREFHDKFYPGDLATGAIVVGRPARSYEVGQWNDQLPLTHFMATEMEVASRVIALADFVGNPQNSPFWDMVENSNSEPQVFESKLLQLAVQFKWEKVRALAQRALGVYVSHFLLMCVALLYDTQGHLEDACSEPPDNPQQSSFSGLGEIDGASYGAPRCAFHYAAADGTGRCLLHDTTVLDALYSGLFVSNSYMLLNELREVVDVCRDQQSLSKGLKIFWSDAWNYFDVGSIAMVYWAMAAHYTHKNCVVEQVGAMAIILNSVSVLQLMRPFTKTGALIQTIIEICKDIRGFWYICAVILMGFTCAFTVCEPQNKGFTMADPRVGAFYPVVEVVISMVGAFSLDDYSKTQTVLLFFVFVIFVIIIMLNLLITIIGESYGHIKQQEKVTMLKLRAEVIVEQERRHPEWWTNTKHDEGKMVYYNIDTGVTQTRRPSSIPEKWRGLNHKDNDCHVGHNGMPTCSGQGSNWILRRQNNCHCRACVYPRYLHFAEPAASSQALSARSSYQLEQEFRINVRADMNRLKRELTGLATKQEVGEVMQKMDKLEGMLAQLLHNQPTTNVQASGAGA